MSQNSDMSGDVDIIASGRHLQLVARRGWEFVRRVNVAGVVAIIAVTDDDQLVLIEQDRPAVGGAVIDLPAGLAGDGHAQADEDLVTAASRELVEETGFEAQQFDVLTAGPSSAGLTSEIITFFRAGRLTKVGPGGGDESENIQVHTVPLNAVAGWLQQQSKRGAIIDPKIYVGLYFVASEKT